MRHVRAVLVVAALPALATLLAATLPANGPAGASLLPPALRFPPPADHLVPYQYIAKAYTELLGEAPTPTQWAAGVAYFAAAGCTAATLRQFGHSLITSAAYRGDYPRSDAGAVVLTLYRFVLNREPDAAGYVANRDLIARGTLTAASAARNLYDTSEFATLTEPAICSTTNPSYYFGQPGNWAGFPAIQTPASGAPGPDDGEAALQQQLDAVSGGGGGTVALPAREVVGLTTTLVVPGNVTLVTAGDPDPHRYADMARLVRLPSFADPAGSGTPELVRLQPGAKVEHLWIDGQRDAPDPSSFAVFDVRMLGGAGTTVQFDRIGNPDGASNLEDDSAAANVAGATACSANVVSDNLVEAYATSHTVLPGDSPDDHTQADGLGIYCEAAEVERNALVDISDAAIVLFAGAPTIATVPPQLSLVADNTIISAGNSYSFGIVTDPFFTLHDGSTPGGDPADATSRAFATAPPATPAAAPPATPAAASAATTAVIRHNLLWSGNRTHFDAILSAGSHDLFGSTVHQNCRLPAPVGPAECGGGRNATGAAWIGNSSGGQLSEAEMGIYVGGTSGTVIRGNRFPRLVEVAGGLCPKAAVVVAWGNGGTTDFAPGLRIDVPYARDTDLASDSCINPSF